MAKLGVAVVGSGIYGEVHARTYSKRSGVELVHIWSRRASRAKSVAFPRAYFKYLIVLARSLCPIHCWTVLRSTPACRCAVAILQGNQTLFPDGFQYLIVKGRVRK